MNEFYRMIGMGVAGHSNYWTDQNKDSARLEFPMRTAVHGKSRVSSAISICHN